MEPATYPPCAHCAEPAKLNCARCKTTAYCSVPCQKAHWRAHKPACNAPERPEASPPLMLPPAPVDPHCSHCGKDLRPGEGVCAACWAVAFCGLECQAAAWLAHKPACLAGQRDAGGHAACPRRCAPKHADVCQRIGRGAQGAGQAP